ncbi:MAG: glycosyltransferase involved in cell wall biosynthesis [Myxococcota bacterium]|jgi:glycosyltransferase involved in cell wall biosynthesis
MSLGLSIPLYNEADSLPDTVRDLLAALDGIEASVVLVDNGSADSTPHIIDTLAARHPQLSTLHLSVNAGYGGGILAGVRALLAAPRPAEVIGWMWGDNQIDPTILPALYARCLGGASLAKAQRTVRQDGRRRRLIATGYAAVMRAGMGVETPDVNGCPKLFRREVLSELALSSEDWFLDAEAILKLEAAGLPVASEPAVMRPRLQGESKVRWQTVAEFIVNLVRVSRGRAPRAG